MTIRRIALSVAILSLAACASGDGGDSGSSETNILTGESSGDGSDAGTGTPTDDMSMAETGWLSIGEDGSVYTTFFDASGTYRDFRNGEFLQSGGWTRRGDGRICFMPAAGDRTGACWSIGALEEDGTMRGTNSQDRAIELKKVTYLAPEPAEGETDVNSSAETIPADEG